MDGNDKKMHIVIVAHLLLWKHPKEFAKRGVGSKAMLPGGMGMQFLWGETLEVGVNPS